MKKKVFCLFLFAIMLAGMSTFVFASDPAHVHDEVIEDVDDDMLHYGERITSRLRITLPLCYSGDMSILDFSFRVYNADNGELLVSFSTCDAASVRNHDDSHYVTFSYQRLYDSIVLYFLFDACASKSGCTACVTGQPLFILKEESQVTA
ncbi:MAG: hypothetical protein FWC92_02120 [Defluviitaleaceae bacterium]|nr:hypothetical protein [Defluviitaleaceae bacterium]